MRLAVIGCLVAATAVSAAAPRAVPTWETLPMPPAMPTPVTQGHIDVGDARIYYATFGKGDPVILLHGGLGNADHFAFQVPALAENHQVICIDSRGQGRSTLPTSKARLSYHAMAGDVIAVMDALKVGKAAFVGWSDGGEIALDLAINQPSRVSRLFVFGSNYDSNGSKSRRGPRSNTFEAYASKCRADWMKLGRDVKMFSTVVDAMMPVWHGPTGFTKEQLRGIAAPAVVSDGDHDEVIELDQVKEMAVLIPNAKLVVFPNTSHFALWQDPTAFNRAVLDFLAAR